MSRRPELAALALSLALVATACGSSSAGPTGPDAGPAPSIGALAVTPPAGPIGTIFNLAAKGLKEGDAVTFEITFPGQGKAFPGAALPVAADGTVSTTYRATMANQPGIYLVRLSGPPGTLAEGRFTVTAGPPLTSTIPEAAGPSTTARTGTTKATGRTTTTVKGGSTTTSTVKGGTTTSTTKKVTTPSSTTTTKARTSP
jgi:hypothetical protein